ncbi:hypothetical protein DTO013E5_6039 [Penicillium roqueforti]|uniref:uncharacterized protein n=1 Tax=Penicillium roqueforti TaxID=5082 RepID=UPI00190B3262|nr:uncharacterized protein LCP9604111_6427 [Penicillium roqueforti]KAF9246667.1 hypothetical protein LCP9604111_6427 [Penicillium roqueforti]KAI2695489.1 hypothetical protein CBS147372_9118 [Penicillium roqueforti]KAI2695857.1 hypothetical protein CBS147332_9242 [Penicillium roqueforti]KAI2710708.1 hypothetical protein CBS147354_8548 [Penicillium roqueforti]KAI2737019.1 hypothetical protein DTO012A1_7889 [Penicillium roqueforti]
MKVHHGRGPRRYYEQEGRGLDIHVLEATTYTRLKEQGLCDRGIVPDFLGFMRKFDPSLCQPHLRKFLDDEYPPSAIFLEYITSLGMINLRNYTPQRVNNLLKGIRQIHKTQRVVWLDFDRAETYDKDHITVREDDLINEEEAIVMEFKDAIAVDIVKGKFDETYLFSFGS